MCTALVVAPETAAIAEAPLAALTTVDTSVSTLITPEMPVLEESSKTEPEFEVIGSGIASFYGDEFAGSRTASGVRFDPGALTAAHRTLPFGTQVRVTNRANGESVVVTINDRGPFHSKRLIDLSHAAAQEIGIVRSGSGKVDLAIATDD